MLILKKISRRYNLRLYAQTLKNYIDINNFQVTSEWKIREEQEVTLHLRLTDLDKDNLRYISKADVIEVKVDFLSIDDMNEVTIDATNPDVDDKSIWQIIIPSDQTPMGGNFVVTIIEDGKITKFSVLQGIAVEKILQGGC
jgi:hypothetical protein